MTIRYVGRIEDPHTVISVTEDGRATNLLEGEGISYEKARKVARFCDLQSGSAWDLMVVGHDDSRPDSLAVALRAMGKILPAGTAARGLLARNCTLAR